MTLFVKEIENIFQTVVYIWPFIHPIYYKAMTTISKNSVKPFSIELQGHLFVFQAHQSQMLIPGKKPSETKTLISVKTKSQGKDRQLISQ